MRLHLQKLSKAVRPLPNGKRTDLSRRVDVAHIGSHTSDKGHDIVQRQGCDLGVELQKQRKRLANAAGSTYNADLHHVDNIFKTLKTLMQIETEGGLHSTHSGHVNFFEDAPGGTFPVSFYWSTEKNALRMSPHITSRPSTQALPHIRRLSLM